jgi:hypothetical protein
MSMFALSKFFFSSHSSYFSFFFIVLLVKTSNPPLDVVQITFKLSYETMWNFTRSFVSVLGYSTEENLDFLRIHWTMTISLTCVMLQPVCCIPIAISHSSVDIRGLFSYTLCYFSCESKWWIKEWKVYYNKARVRFSFSEWNRHGSMNSQKI